MNEKLAKRIRREMRARLREPRAYEYEEVRIDGMRAAVIFRNDVVDWMPRTGIEVVYVTVKDVVLVHRRLRPGCGRHIYKQAKERVRVRADQLRRADRGVRYSDRGGRAP